MIKKRTKLIGNIPTKAKGTSFQSNQKPKQGNNTKTPIQSSLNNLVLIKKIPFNKQSNKNSFNNTNINLKNIENDINRVEMKIDQITEESLGKDSHFHFQRETDQMCILRNYPQVESINQIININIYNNMNETIKTCSGKNANTQREDSFIQNISIGDIDIHSKNLSILNYNNLSTNLNKNIKNTNLIEEINIIEKDAEEKVINNSSKEKEKNSNSNISSTSVKELGLKTDNKDNNFDKQKLITVSNNNNCGKKKRMMIYTSIGVGIVFIIVFICFIIYIFKKNN